jgi:NitT/TauT family transport system permease protein
VVKAYTLGATTTEVALKVILPQIVPRILDSIRLTVGPAWVFLIAAEAISSDSGLGYASTSCNASSR